MIEEITSLKDERIQLAKSVNSQKGRIEKQKFLIEGIEAIDWAIDSEIKLDFILMSNKLKDIEERFLKHTIYKISEGLLKKVTETNYVVPVIAIGNVKKETAKSEFYVRGVAKVHVLTRESTIIYCK